MPTEVEARFRADGPRPLRDLATADHLGRARLGAARAFDEVDAYLDTEAGALSDARWACRLRTRGGRTVVSMKGPPEASPAGGIHRRPEVEGPATPSRDPSEWPPSPARDLVDRLRGGARLVERLTLHQRRTERDVVLEPNRVVATLSLDEVRAVAPGAELGTFAVVEVELVAGDDRDEGALRELAAALAARPGLRPDPQTKLERALELGRRR